MNSRVVIPIVAGVCAIVVWVLTREGHDGHKNQYLLPLGVFVGVLILGQILVGIVQGMREGSRRPGSAAGKKSNIKDGPGSR